MIRFLAVFAVALALVFSTTPAEARKFGGSRSFGKTYQTAPRAPANNPSSTQGSQGAAQQQNLAQRQQAAPNAAASVGKKGMMAGLLGGLLAGGLLGAMLGHGFQGLQFLDILIFALLGFVIFKLLRRRQQQRATPAMAGAGGGRFDVPEPANAPQERRTFDLGNPDEKVGAAAASAPAFSPSAAAATDTLGWGNETSVPFNLPAGFDMNSFLTGAREHYRTIQEAWNKGNLETLREYLAPELFDALSAERATLKGEQHTEVMFVDAELVRADQNATLAEVSLRFSGRYRDQTEGVEDAITDVWHLERDLSKPDQPWLIVGIEEV
ncbi:Hypothetical protein HDN1F_19260 [gamma proteobacterium HdN1]|nr:Hypothetical protein HDN1F_19260 [gamma proteobacterium HdN1]